MNSTSLKDRLRERITEAYTSIGGYVEDDFLYISEQKIALAPLLNIPKRILQSPEFTHLPSLLGSDRGLPMASMYVELAVANVLGQADPARLQSGLTLAEALEDKHASQRARRLTVDQAIHNEQHKNIVILGDPGSGKTSLLKYICLEVAKGNSEKWIFPIFISLRRYWLEKQRNPHIPLTFLHYAAIVFLSGSNASNITPYMSLFLGLPYKNSQEEIEQLENIISYLSGSNREHVLFLLDGFDEIASQLEAVESLTEEIRQLGYSFSWILTSRKTGFYGGLDENIRYEVVSLHNQAMETLVSNWFQHSKRRRSQNAAQLVLKQIRDNPRLQVMARNPFLLTLLCYLQQEYASPLPLQRSEIYGRLFRLVREQLQKRKKNPKLFGLKEYQYLSKFSYFLYTDAPNAPLQLFDRDLWDLFALPDVAPDLDKHFLSSRLLNRWGEAEDYHLIHLTLQEYLVAVSLLDKPFAKIVQHLYHPHWRVVLRFLGGIYWSHQRKDDFIKLLKVILEPLDQLGLLYTEAAWLLLEAGIEDSTELLGYDLREQLWQTWCDYDPYLSDVAGEALAFLSPTYAIKKVKTLLADDKLDQRKEKPKEKPDVASLVRLLSQTKQPPNTNLARTSVRLLGKVTNQDSDDLLIELLSSDNETYVNAAALAIADKNTPELRALVLSKANDLVLNSLLFRKICLIAEKSKHTDFLPWLLSWLTTKPKKPDDYNYIFLAIKSIASPTAATALLIFVSEYKAEELPFEVLETIAIMQTSEVRSWFTQQMKVSKEAKERLLITAIEYDQGSTEMILEAFKGVSEDALHALVDVLGDRAENGFKTDHRVINLVAKVAFSESEQEIPAFSALVKIETAAIKQGVQEGSTYRVNFLKGLEHPETDVVIDSIFILGQMQDITGMDKLLDIVQNHEKVGYRMAAIDALAHYKHIDNKHLILDVLHHIIDQEDTDTTKHSMIESAADTIAAIDFRELARYDTNGIARNARARACAEQGILFFDDFYVDKSGIAKTWKTNEVFHLHQENLETDNSDGAKVHKEKIRLLLLSANPAPSEPTNADKEFRNIKEGIKLAYNGSAFVIEQSEATRLKDLRRVLLNFRPDILHFSGHGISTGILLEDNNGMAKLVTGKDLVSYFKPIPSLKCVILNACDSISVGKEVVKVVPYVIVAKEKIKNQVAMEFSGGFYDALGCRKNISDAFDIGVSAVEMVGESADAIITLLKKSNSV